MSNRKRALYLSDVFIIVFTTSQIVFSSVWIMLMLFGVGFIVLFFVTILVVARLVESLKYRSILKGKNDTLSKNQRTVDTIMIIVCSASIVMTAYMSISFFTALS